MKYNIKRAIHTEFGVFNMGDTVVIYMEGQEPIQATLKDIFWHNEYQAYVVTSQGNFDLEDMLGMVYGDISNNLMI